jgi:hypothetical protein
MNVAITSGKLGTGELKRSREEHAALQNRILMSGIGTLNERPLHAALKEWYAVPGDQFEEAVDGFVIDIVRDELLLEIQTGTFAPIKSKLNKLVRTHRTRLIYPIAQEKWIVKLAKDDGDGSTRRKSPKRGRVEDLFRQMVSIPTLLANDNFELEVLMIKQEEVRRYDGNRNWRRKGWGVEERRLLKVVDRRLFTKPADLRELLPEQLESPFTTKELAEAAGIQRRLAQEMAYCLRKMSVIELVGKRQRANLYKLAEA